MPETLTKSGQRYTDLKSKITALESKNSDLQFQIGELKRVLRESICPHCMKVRKESHIYKNGNEIACPAFAFGPFPTTGRKNSNG